MPSASNLVIADSVPVSRTYVPQSVSNSAVTLVDKTTALSVSGQGTIVLDFSPVSSKRKTDRINMRLNLPKTVSVSGVETVESVARFNGDFIIPETWVTLERNNFIKLVSNMLANTVVQGYVKDRDPMF